jgi:hypothetical protein
MQVSGIISRSFKSLSSSPPSIVTAGLVGRSLHVSDVGESEPLKFGEVCPGCFVPRSKGLSGFETAFGSRFGESFSDPVDGLGEDIMNFESE